MVIQSLKRPDSLPEGEPNAPASNIGWEYMTMTYTSSYGSTSYVINGEKAINIKNRPLHDVLTLHGQDRWELVSINEGLFIFKRYIK